MPKTCQKFYNEVEIDYILLQKNTRKEGNMSKVLTLGLNDLFTLVPYFQGFKPLERLSLSELENRAIWVEKEEAEKNPRFKQLIGYSAVITPGKKVFVYRRSKQDKEYPEKRLQGKWSIGIGGHIENIDRGDLIMASTYRELDEEIKDFGNILSVQLLGAINDDTNPVGQVHFGLLMAARVSADNIRPRHKEVEIGEPKALEDLRLLFNLESDNVESWSKICLPEIVNFLT